MDYPLTAIKVVAPSIVVAGEPVSIGIRMETEAFYVRDGFDFHPPAMHGTLNERFTGCGYMSTVPPAYTETVTIDGGSGYSGPSELSFSEGSGPITRPQDLRPDPRPIRRIDGITYANPGTYTITVTEPTSGLKGTSNPILVVVERPDEYLYWGDLHCHTGFSDGLRSPEELYAFARDEAFLDIFALSDHSENLTDRQWDYFTSVTNDVYEPHRFATLVGMEWTNHELGHRNVYYRGDSGPLLSFKNPAYNTLAKLYEAVHAHQPAMVVPHHSANRIMGVDWSLGHDPELERLVEIYSMWGNSERPAEAGNPRPILLGDGEKAGQHVVDALNLGRRFGILAGGDIHDGRPGDNCPAEQFREEGSSRCHRQGIMGVWAKELTREAVFDALWNRRVFGTTNIRIILRFSVGGAPMGSEVGGNDHLPVVVEVVSEVPIARIDLVGNGADIETHCPDGGEVTWQTEVSPTSGNDWYYARITRADGEMAWSSPVWVRQD